MKYRLKVYYRTPLMEKITKFMHQVMDDWKQTDKHLEGCWVFEFETDAPVSAELKRCLLALKEDWMEKVELEEVKHDSL